MVDHRERLAGAGNSHSLKRPHSGGNSKPKYRPRDGAGWTKRTIDGPGVWATCVKGKEKQAVGELYDLFEAVASDIWPLSDDPTGNLENSDDDEDLPIEAQIAKEVAAAKRPKRETRFSNCQTGTPCVVFIACRPPVDPVTMVVSHVENVQRTGISRTRYTHRLVPSSNTCAANLPDITNLCKQVFDQFFQNNPGPSSYKIELRIRNHTTHTRDLLIPHIAACLPNNLTVKLDAPEVFILVEIFKSVCGIGVVKDYYRFQKFNIMEVGKSKGIDDNFRSVGGRLSGDKPDSESQIPTTTASAQPDT